MHVDAGYKAIKLRLGDNVKDDLRRVEAVRDAFGDDLEILTDANIGYTIEDVRRVMPVLEDLGVRWLEEPFPRSTTTAATPRRELTARCRSPRARTTSRASSSRASSRRRASTSSSPTCRRAAASPSACASRRWPSAHKLEIHPHSSMTGHQPLPRASTSSPRSTTAGYFEADVSKNNLFRDELCSKSFEIAKDGTVRPLEAPGIGVEVDEDFLKAHPVIEGPAVSPFRRDPAFLLCCVTLPWIPGLRRDDLDAQSYPVEADQDRRAVSAGRVLTTRSGARSPRSSTEALGAACDRREQARRQTR